MSEPPRYHFDSEPLNCPTKEDFEQLEKDNFCLKRFRAEDAERHLNSQVIEYEIRNKLKKELAEARKALVFLHESNEVGETANEGDWDFTNHQIAVAQKENELPSTNKHQNLGDWINR